MNKISTAFVGSLNYAAGLAQGTNTFSMDDREASGLMAQFSKLLPIANSLPMQVAREMFSPTRQNNALRNKSYYEVLQMKRQMQFEREKLLARFR